MIRVFIKLFLKEIVHDQMFFKVDTFVCRCCSSMAIIITLRLLSIIFKWPLADDDDERRRDSKLDWNPHFNLTPHSVKRRHLHLITLTALTTKSHKNIFLPNISSNNVFLIYEIGLHDFLVPTLKNKHHWPLLAKGIFTWESIFLTQFWLFLDSFLTQFWLVLTQFWLVFDSDYID